MRAGRLTLGEGDGVAGSEGSMDEAEDDAVDGGLIEPILLFDLWNVGREERESFEPERWSGVTGAVSCRYSRAAVSLRASSESSRITSSQLLTRGVGAPRTFRSPRSGLLRRGEIEFESGPEEEVRWVREVVGDRDAARDSTGRRQGTFQKIASSGRSSSSSSYSASSSLVVLRLPFVCQLVRWGDSIGLTSEWKRGV